MAAIALRDYQEDGVAGIRAAFREKQYPVLFVLPTGGGKTYTFCYIASAAANKGNRVIIIVHRKELLLQASKSLRALGIDHGLISPHFTESPHKMIQVASIDTLMIRLKKWPEKYKFTLAVYDEGHHATAKNKWGIVHELLGMPISLLVTATPQRGDGIGLGAGQGGICKTMVMGPSPAELIQRGMLLNPTVYTCNEPPDFSGLKVNKDGDFNAQDLAERTDKPKITGSAVAHYKEICPGARAIVFCTNIKHATNVVNEFNAAGFKFALLVGEPAMSDAERTSVNKALASGELDGACTVDLVSEGYDLPDLACCIMLRRTESVSLFLQQVGRIMRPAPGKTMAYLLDHVANTGIMKNGGFVRKHGLPSDVREWSLEGRKKRGKKPVEDDITLKQCPKCYHVFEPEPNCPKCGHDMRPKERGLEQVDGKLEMVTAEMAAQQEQAARAQQRAEQASAKTVDEMVGTLGYKRGRAEAIVKARQEKQELRDGLIADLRAWHTTTGQAPLATFGVAISDIRMLKPAGLKDLRARFEEHRASTVAPRTQETEPLAF